MHVLRPLGVVFCIVGVILLVRVFVVPKTFGAHERGYMYGWHNKANEDFWHNFTVKYRGREYCKDCHDEEWTKVSASPHAIIQCENCHGPAIEHPDTPSQIAIDRSRALCVRCHAKLPYAQSDRADIKGIDPVEHNSDMECVECHSSHSPKIGD